MPATRTAALIAFVAELRIDGIAHRVITLAPDAVRAAEQVRDRFSLGDTHPLRITRQPRT